MLNPAKPAALIIVPPWPHYGSANVFAVYRETLERLDFLKRCIQ